MEQKKRCLALLVAVIALFVFTLPAMASDGKVNINTATEKELCTLKRVGPKYAKRIIEHRNKEGAFNTPKDIIKVKGIGPKTFEANKAFIVVKDGD
ncbi:MAG: helix-hairpin-helix domain-containing protein [Desulfobacterium sp.]|nr:helix-hairpin-helix domain-containing protein [Desulfobacterium sp.]